MKKSLILLLAFWGCCLFATSQKLRLFHSEQRQSVCEVHQVAIMDFLERYFSEIHSLNNAMAQTQMADDKVFFRKGKPSDLYQLGDSLSFSINQLDRYYEVNWLKSEDPLVSIVFPAQYDLILGKQQEEAQQKLKDVILLASENADAHIVRNNLVQLPSLQKLDDNIFVAQNEFFELESLNDAMYYILKDKKYSPLYDSEHLDYSAANLFQGIIKDVDYRMVVEQSVYGLKTISYTITLKQWLDYCSVWNLKTFFAIEEQREDGILAMAIVQDREFNYNHLLSIVIPDKIVRDKDAVIKIRLTPYIPTHNVKDLYKKESANRKRIQWQ